MEKPLSPPPPVYDAFKPRDQWIARVIDLNPLEKPNIYEGCKNGSDLLARMVEIAEASTFGASHLFTRP